MRNEKGSITLFVLIAMIFFLVIAMSAYASSSNKLQAQNAELERIKAGYEQDITAVGLATLYEKMTEGIPSDDYLALKEGDTVYYKDANNNDIECTVLYASKDSSGNDTLYYNTYGVQIIPRNPVTTVQLGNGTGNDQTDATNFATAKNSYNNAIGTLNTAAATYVSANSNLSAIAQSSRCVGSIPNDPSARNTATYSHESGTNDYFASFDGQFEAGEEDSAYITSNVVNYTVDKTQLDSLSIATITDGTNGWYYWLASRDVATRSDFTSFIVHYAYSSGYLSNVILCRVDSDNSTNSFSESFGLRPVITLKTNIKATETNNKKYLNLE